MEDTKGPISTHPKPTDSRNVDNESKLYTLKEVPKKSFVQIKESFRSTFKISNRPQVVVKGKIFAPVIKWDKCFLFFKFI